MTAYPRRISRGILKGQAFASEAEYRKARAEATGVTRYAQRKAKAQKMGYTGYTERRKVLKKLGGNKKAEKALLNKSTNKQERRWLADEVENYKTRSKEWRIAAAEAEAAELGVSLHSLYAMLYRAVDAKGLR